MERFSKLFVDLLTEACFIPLFTVYKQDVIDLCRNRYQGSPKPTYKDKPTTTSTANAQSVSHNAPHQNGHQSQHVTKQYGRETVINGHHGDDRPSGAYASRQNPSHHATVNQRQIETELTVSHSSALKKQTTFSHVDSSERTELHSTSVNSGVNRRQCANPTNQTSNCQAISANNTIYHNATQFANCPPIPPHNVSYGKSKSSQNASGFANCPPIPPHGAGFGHGKPAYNAKGHDSSSHNASGHVYSPVFPGVPHSLSGFGHGALTHNTSGHIAIQPSQNAPGHTSNPSSHNSTAYSKSLPPHQASGHGNHLTPHSQGNARRTKSEPDDDDVCQIRNDTQDGCRIRVNTEHFIYRRNAVRETKQGAGSKSPTRDNRTWREYRHNSGGQRSQSQSDDSTTTTRAHEPIWRRKSEDLRSQPLVTGMPTKALPRKSEDLQSPPLITSTGVRTQKSENLQAPPLVAGMLTQKSKETEINGVCTESETQPNEVRKDEPIRQKVGSSSSGHSATHNAPGHTVTHNASAQAATHNASAKAATYNAQGHAASNNASEYAATNNASGHFVTHNASGQSEVGKESQKRENSEADRGKEEEKKWCALILLVPVRLGGDEVNPIYVNPLRSLFTLESCMGIIGGKPKHSLYYVGFQG